MDKSWPTFGPFSVHERKLTKLNQHLTVFESHFNNSFELGDGESSKSQYRRYLIETDAFQVQVNLIEIVKQKRSRKLDQKICTAVSFQKFA